MDHLQFALTSFVALFFVVDPFAAVPLLLAMTAGDTSAHRRKTARRAAVTVGVVLLVFSLSGPYLLRLFGIGVAAFQIAGGSLLFLLALEMMRAQLSPTRTREEEVAEGVDKPEVGTVPLGVPMLAGPGAMSTATVLVHSAGSPLRISIVGACILATAILTYFVLLSADAVRRILKTTGLNVLTRVMGLLLAAVAIEFITTGLRETFPILAGAAR